MLAVHEDVSCGAGIGDQAVGEFLKDGALACDESFDMRGANELFGIPMP